MTLQSFACLFVFGFTLGSLWAWLRTKTGRFFHWLDMEDHNAEMQYRHEKSAGNGLK